MSDLLALLLFGPLVPTQLLLGQLTGVDLDQTLAAKLNSTLTSVRNVPPKLLSSGGTKVQETIRSSYAHMDNLEMQGDFTY